MVVSAGQLVTFGAACVVLIAVPGPAVTFIIGRALAHGRRTALTSMLGNSIGSYAVAVVIALGLGSIVAGSPIVFAVVKYLGAAYLVFLGIQTIRHRKDGITATLTQSGTVASRARRDGFRQFRQGIIVGVTNPKVYIVFAAILPQFVRTQAGHIQLQMLILALVPTVIGLITDSGWALIAGAARSFFAKSPRRIEAFGAAGGAAIVGLGVVTALTKA